MLVPTPRTEKQNPPYMAVEPQTPGQYKRLAEVSLGVLPADLPKGFAQLLIDGELRKIVSKGIDQARWEWRERYMDFRFEADNLVGANAGGPLHSRFSVDITGRVIKSTPVIPGKQTIVYEGVEDPRWAVWKRQNAPTPENSHTYFYWTSSLTQRKFLEVLGEKPEEYQVSPLQVFDLVRDWIIESDSKHPYQFFIGLFEGSPVFLEAQRRGPSNFWRFSDDYWHKPYHGAENFILVLGKKLPK